MSNLSVVRCELRLHPEDVPAVKAFAAGLWATRARQMGLSRMPLIEQARHACDVGDLPRQFTPAEFKRWIRQAGITKRDGTDYAESSINALLSNSDIANKGSTNRNKKVLQSVEQGGQKYFSFI